MVPFLIEQWKAALTVRRKRNLMFRHSGIQCHLKPGTRLDLVLVRKIRVGAGSQVNQPSKRPCIINAILHQGHGAVDMGRYHIGGRYLCLFQNIAQKGEPAPAVSHMDVDDACLAGKDAAYPGIRHDFSEFIPGWLGRPVV